MTAPEVPVGPGTQVELRFTLRLGNGELVDSTGERAARFIVGDGNLPPGFERAMFGMKKGEKAEFNISAAEGFGDWNPDNVQKMPSKQFSKELELTEGLVVSFRDQSNGELPGVVVSVAEDLVEVDFNHPLSGRDLVFEVDIVAVEQISNEILRM